MHNLLFELTEDNPIFNFVFGSDSATHRRVAFISAVYDTMVLSALVNVSFAFGGCRAHVKAWEAQRVRVLTYGRSFAAAFAVSWFGHFVVSSATNTAEKRIKSARQWMSQSWSDKKNAWLGRANITSSSHSADGVVATPATSSSRIISKIATATLLGSSPIIETPETKAKITVDNALNNVPISFGRRFAAVPATTTTTTTSSNNSTRTNLVGETLRAAVLAPGDALAVGLFSSYYLGKPKTFDGVLDLVLRTKRWDILIPTCLVSMMLRLAPEYARALSSMSFFKSNSVDDSSSTTLEWITRYVAVPSLSALALRAVSSKWTFTHPAKATTKSAEATAAATETTAGEATSTTSKATTKSTRGRAFISGLKFWCGRIATFPAMMSSVAFSTVQLPVAILFCSLYLSYVTLAATAVSSLMIGVEAGALWDENDSRKRNRHGKYLCNCSSNLPSHFCEAVFVNTAGATRLLASVKEALFVAVVSSCSTAGRKHILQEMLSVCKIEQRAIGEALMAFELPDLLLQRLNDNASEMQVISRINVAERRETLRELLRRLQSMEKELNDALESVNNSNSNSDGAFNKMFTVAARAKQEHDNQGKVSNSPSEKVSSSGKQRLERLPRWLQLEYQLRKTTPGLASAMKLREDEHSLLLTVATQHLLRELNKNSNNSSKK